MVYWLGRCRFNSYDQTCRISIMIRQFQWWQKNFSKYHVERIYSFFRLQLVSEQIMHPSYCNSSTKLGKNLLSRYHLIISWSCWLKNYFSVPQNSFIVILNMIYYVPPDNTSTETVAETIQNSQELAVKPLGNSSIADNSSSTIEPHSARKHHHHHKQFCRKCCHTPP